MTTGERIKATRELVGMTQAELAEKLGVSYQSISQWERDVRKPKIKTIYRIAEAMNVLPNELLTETEVMGVALDLMAKSVTVKKNQIRATREAAGMTLEELARISGIGSVAIKQYENNVKKPSIEEIKSLSIALVVAPAFLMGWEHINKDGLPEIDTGGVALYLSEIMGIDWRTVVTVMDSLNVAPFTIEDLEKIVEELEKLQFDNLVEDETQSIYLDAIRRGMQNLNGAGQQRVVEFAVNLAEDLAKIPEYQRSPDKK